MRTLSFILLFLTVNVLFAQSNQNKGGYDPSKFKIGTINGRILDPETKNGVEFVSVAAYSFRDSSVAGGTITDAKGYFTMKEMPPGKFFLKASFIGFKETTIGDVLITPKQREIQLADATLISDMKALDAVEIEAERKFVENKVDRKVFNISKNIAAKSGTVTDLLQDIPAVEVDVDGTVSYRGNANVTILIDGRPAGVSADAVSAFLRQLPANQIENIEVISNPSAKFNPEGVTGIINIVTKKEKRKGYNGSVIANIGTNNKYNTSANISIRNGKWNYGAALSYNHSRFNITDTVYGTYILTDSVLNTNQRQNSERNSDFSLAKFDLGYAFNDDHRIDVSVSGNFRPSTSYGDVTYQDNYSTNYTLRTLRNTTQTNENYGLNVNGAYTGKFAKPGRELRIEYTHNFNPGSDSLIADQELFENNIPDGKFSKPERIATFSKYLEQQGRIDYTDKFGNAKFETGYFGLRRQNSNDLNAYLGSSQGSEELFFNDSSRTNEFEYNELQTAVYSTFGQEFEKISWQLGLRYEYVITEGELVTTGETFNNPYSSFFPSLNFVYKQKDNLEYNLGFSRRVNRPRSRQLNPFPSYDDPRNIRKGNPEILPEYTNAAEFGMNYFKGNLNVNLAIYYRMTTNEFSRVTSADSITGISTTSFENLNSSQAIGSDLVVSYKISKMFNLNTNISAYQLNSDGSNINAQFTASAFRLNWNTRLTARLPKDFSAQVNNRFRSGFEYQQGKILPRNTVDVSLRKTFLNKKASVFLNVSDIFNTGYFRIETFGPGFERNLEFKWETRIAFLGFSYTFGQFDPSLFNRRRGGGRSSGGGGDDMPF